ncbi:PucR family transcriptional regulator [Lentibacillus cibarius]|nr:helix-turn-helix domain-containing protein [Lentibacillus cibarius]
MNKGDIFMSHSADYSKTSRDTLDSPEGLADRIAEILECPITIEDANHRIISYSKHDKNVDEARIATIMRRSVPEDVITSLWESGVMSRLFESNDPVFVPAIEKVGLGNRIAVSVHKHHDVLGFIWAQTNDTTITNEKMSLMKDAAKLVKNQLHQHHLKKKQSEESYQEFFWQLLVGHLQQPGEISQQAKRFGLAFGNSLCIAMIEISYDITPTIEKHAYYLIETLYQPYAVCRIFNENQLIMLVNLESTPNPNNKLKTLIQDFIQKLTARLNIGHVKGGFGLTYDSPENMKDSYRQAMKVLELKEQLPDSLQHVYGYHELGIYQFLQDLNAIRNRDNYRNDAIERLRAYDKKNGSALVKTLHAYLDCDSNVHNAAKQIHVHTNTLNYRLKRITDIGEIDLKDTNQKITLYLDLLIEKIND